MNNIKIFKTIKYALGILSICTLMSIATFSTQTKAEVSGEKVTTSVEAVTTKPSESTKTTETTKLAETTKPQETTKASNIKKSALNPVKSKVILLDPGHCKKHIGARGNGLKEEDVNLDIGKACRNYLNKYSDVTVYMTRTNSKCVKKLKLGDCLTARNHLAKGNGVVVTNQIYTDGVKSYFFKKSGKRKNGWVTYKNAKYYFSKTKGMLKGKQKIKGKRYTFSKKTGKLKKKK